MVDHCSLRGPLSPGGRRACPRLALAAFLVAGCSGAPEQSVISQFFEASRLRDTTALANMATVIFEPREQGTVTAFTIQSVGLEQRRPIGIKALSKAQDDARSDDATFTKRKEDYQNANLEAIQRVLKSERGDGKLAGKDAEVQATWTKFREESALVSKKVADSRQSLRAETKLVDVSINAGRRSLDVTKADGEIATKDVTVTADVQQPNGQAAQKTIVITLQKATLKGDRETEGRWVVTGFKDGSGSPATPRS